MYKRRFPWAIVIIGFLLIILAVIAYLFFYNKGSDYFDTPPTTTIYAPLPENSPTPSPRPTATIAILPSAKTEPIITQAPTPIQVIYRDATVWANALQVHQDPRLESPIIDKVRYGERFTVYGEEHRFVKIMLYSGGYGWIWEAYTARGNDILPPRPDTPTPVPTETPQPTITPTPAPT